MMMRTFPAKETKQIDGPSLGEGMTATRGA